MKGQFTGRQAELRQIFTLFEKGPSRVLLSMFGDGGVGKTTLAHETVRQINAVDREDWAAVVIDFDLTHTRVLSAIRGALAKAWGEQFFASYWEALEEFEEIESLQASWITQQRAAQRLDAAFKKGIARAATACRLLVAFDTIERIQWSGLFSDVLDLLRQLDNVVILIIGRYNEQVTPQLMDVYGPETFRTLEVKYLDLSQSERYLSDLVGALDPDIHAKLCLLAQGKPILLDLAATWYLRAQTSGGMLGNWPGKFLLQRSFNELQANLDKYKPRFEYEVIDGVRSLESPLDWAVLYMALLEHPCSVALWRYMFELDEADAKHLTRDLLQLFFVRADYTLHDEMRELVLKHVWPYIDPDGDLRKSTLERLLNFTLEHRTEKPGWERWFQEAEELNYRLMLDIEAGYHHFLDEFDRIRDRGWLSECQLLVQTVQRPYHWNCFSPEMRLDIRVRQAQLYTFLGQEARMEEACHKILDDPNTSNAAKFEAQSSIAYGLRDLNPQASVERYEQALELASVMEDEVKISRVLNWAGQVYRRLGNFEQAIQYFEESIIFSGKHALWSQKATVYNNLAYVYRQLGDVDRAMNLARMAFVLHERLNNVLGLAYSYQTLGEIYKDTNDLITSEERFLEARSIFDSLEREQDVAYVNIALANICRKKHDPDMVERYLDESLEIFKRMRNDEGVGQALNEYGCEIRKRAREISRTLKDFELAEGHFQRAEAYFYESIDISSRMYNWYRLGDNLADLTLLYLYWFENCSEEAPEIRQQFVVKAQDAAAEAIAVARRHGLRLVENRAIETLGTLAYAQQDYFKAFARFYVQACLDMAQYYRAPLWRYQLVFDRVHRRILNPDIPEEEVRFIAAYMARRWREEGKAKIAPGFLSVYDSIAKEWYVGGLYA